MCVQSSVVRAPAAHALGFRRAFESPQFLPFALGRIKPRRLRSGSVQARQSIGDKLFAQILRPDLHERIESFQPAATKRILTAGAHSERLLKFPLRKFLCRFPHFERERGSDSKILGLLIRPIGQAGVSLRCIDEIETKDVLLTADPRMKTVAVVRWIWHETAIL